MAKSKAFQELERLALEANRLRYPNLPDSARFIGKYSDSNSNSLTAAISEYVKLCGGFIARINTMGIIRGGKWTKSGSTLGMPDLQGIYNSKVFYVEIKYGKDKLSEIQTKRIAEIEKAGGFVFVARNFDSFHTWFNENLKK